MRELIHPNLVNYEELFLERGGNSLQMVMEFMKGGALTDVVLYTILGEPQIAAVAKEVTFCTERVICIESCSCILRFIRLNECRNTND